MRRWKWIRTPTLKILWWSWTKSSLGVSYNSGFVGVGPRLPLGGFVYWKSVAARPVT